MEFKINGHTWKIILYKTDRIVEIVNKITQEENSFVYGYTYYPTQKILINQDLSMEQQIFSLKHELTHCYIWNYGLYHVDFNDFEIVCDIVAASNDFVNEVVDRFKKNYKKMSED